MAFRKKKKIKPKHRLSIYIQRYFCVRKVQSIFHMNICEIRYVSIYSAQHASQMEDIILFRDHKEF